MHCSGKYLEALAAYTAGLRIEPENKALRDKAAGAKAAFRVLTQDESLGKRSGQTTEPLFLATGVLNDKKWASDLLKSGVNVDSSDEEGNTSLMQSSHFGHSDMVILLLEQRCGC